MPNRDSSASADSASADSASGDSASGDSASGDSASGDPAPLHLIQSFAGTLSADPDTDPLRSRETAPGWLRTAGLLPAEAGLTTSEHAALLRLRTSIRDVLAAHADGREDAEAAARLTKALADGRLVLVIGPASTVRLASYPNLVAAIAIAMAKSVTAPGNAAATTAQSGSSIGPMSANTSPGPGLSGRVRPPR
jgi:hypothetical protein